MKKGIIIVLISLILILTGLNNVNAATVDGWTLGLDGLNEVYMYDCTGAENCSNNINVNSYQITNTDRYYATNISNATVYTNGVVIHVSESNTYMQGYLYSARIYMCSNIGARKATMFSTTWGNRNKGISYDTYNSAVQTYTMSTVPYGGNTEMTFNKCFAHGVIFSPSTNTTGIEIRFKSPDASQSGVYFDILGLKVENLGVYDKSLVNQIDEIIDNSGYATAESVAEVNTAVNQVKQEVQELNNAQQETNDILTGEQNYNKNPSEEVNGEEEINDYTEKEDQLFSSLDFEGIGDNEIVINPNTSSFIWEIIDRLRGMNGKIVLLMTSILGLGIIKMVLNR